MKFIRALALASLFTLCVSMPPRLGAQNAALMPMPKLQFFDQNGIPLAGGFIYTYAAGTTTPLATYTDSTGSVENPNPVVLDAGGFASIWLGPSAYKIVAQNALGVQVWSQDNVSNLALLVKSGQNGAALVSYTAAGTGAVSRTVGSKLGDTVSVLDFGAAGNGSADDTLHLQAAINYACTVNADVYFPRGTYKTTATLAGCSNQIIQGDGMGATTINYTGAGDAFAWTDASRFTLRDLSVSSAGNALHVIGKSSLPVYPIFERVEITGFGATATGILFDIQGASDIFFPLIRDCVINGGSPAPNVGTRTGISFLSTNPGAGYVTVQPQISGGRILNVQTGISISNAVQQVVDAQTEFDGITTNSSGTGTGIAVHFLSGAYYDLFTDARFEANPAIDKYFVFDSGATNNLVRGVFSAVTSNTVITDAGTNNGWYGTDGSGGAGTGTNLNKLPWPITFTSPITIQGLAALSGGFNWSGTATGPTPADSMFNFGSFPNATARNGVNVAAILAAPNSAWGYPLALVGDSNHKALWFLSQNYNAATNTGSAVSLQDDGHITATTSGSSTTGTLDFSQLQIDSWNGTSGLASAVPIKGYLSATATWAPGSINAGSYGSTSVAVAGCTSTDIAMASYSSIGSTPVILSASPGSGTVYVTAYNASGTTWNPASGTVRASCIKH
jgi:hypothetical protein